MFKDFATFSGYGYADLSVEQECLDRPSGSLSTFIMVAVSLMPPVDYCASCEGQKAEGKARDVAESRQAEEFETHRSNETGQLSPGALPSVAKLEASAKPVDMVARPLLAADLAVQASLALTESTPADPQGNSTLRLKALQAYGAASGV